MSKMRYLTSLLQIGAGSLVLMLLATGPLSPGQGGNVLAQEAPTETSTELATPTETPLTDAVSIGTPPLPVIGQRAALSGTLVVIWGDGPPGSNLATSPEFFLVEDQGGWTIIVPDETLTAPFGGSLAFDRQRVEIVGTWATRPEGGEPSTSLETVVLEVESINFENQPKDQPNEPAIVVGPGPSHRSQRWVTILCRFSDSTGTTPHPKSWFETLMGNSYPGMDHYWRALSYDSINLSGSTVVGWYDLPQPKSFYLNDPTTHIAGHTLNFEVISDDCTAAADTDVNFPDFVGINMMFNENFDCCAWGGAVPDLTRDGQTKTYQATWMPPWGYEDQMVLGQEMGHGFGLPHSSGPYDTPYDSNWDVMSGGGTCSSPHAVYGCIGVRTITYHMDFLGWMPSSRKYLATPGSSQTIEMSRLAVPSLGSGTYLMAQIPIRGSSTSFYTVEVRFFAGYDNQLPGQGVIIHKVDTLLRDRLAQVVDPDGNGNPNDAGAMWIPGETFTDTANGVTVAIIAATSSRVQVKITLAGTGECNILTIDLGLPENTGALDILGVPYTKVSPSDFGSVILSDYDTLYVGWTDFASSTGMQALFDRRADIASFVTGGGGLVALSNRGDSAYEWLWTPVTPSFFIEDNDSVTIVDPAHPVMNGLTDADLSNWGQSYHTPFNSSPSGTTSLAVKTGTSNPVNVAGNYGAGRMVLSGMDPDWHIVNGSDAGAKVLLQNALDWVCGPGGPGKGQDSLGVYWPAASVFFLRNTIELGPNDHAVGFGSPGNDFIPLTGDWDGDGEDTLGVYWPAASVFFLRNTIANGPNDYVFAFGSPGNGFVPVVGDWDGDGKDSVGVYWPAASFFFLRNALVNGPNDYVVPYGSPGNGFVPVTGDWDGDGEDTLGVYWPAASVFFLRNTIANGPNDYVFAFGSPGNGFVPVVGDWDGNGSDSVGVYWPAASFFFLRNALVNGPNDYVVPYGSPGNGFVPLSGDWDG